MQLHGVLAMKAWFKQVMKRAWTKLSITFELFKISSLLTEI
jgi:hypothetical protein